MQGEKIVDLEAHGSLSASTMKEYRSKWEWQTKRAKANLGPCLYEADGVDSAEREFTISMALRCLVIQEPESNDRRGTSQRLSTSTEVYAG